jgi:hypothetical protein
MPTLISPSNMTSDTAPSPYVSLCSTEYGGSPGSNNTWDSWTAFDGAPTSQAGWTGTNHGADWLQIFLGAAYVLGSYEINVNVGTRGPTAWTMEGSNDGVTWTVVDTQTGVAAWANNQTNTYTIATPGAAFSYYRLNISAGGDGTYTNVGQLYLYGPAGVPPPTQRGCIAYDQIKSSDRTGDGDQLLTYSTAPATSGATGTAGQIAYDGSYLYLCVAANTWLRAAIATW